MGAYIYHIIHFNNIYIGQENRSTDKRFGRLEEHIKRSWGMWKDHGRDSSKIIFKTGELRDITFQIYEDDLFGLTRQNYEDFLQFFSPEPGVKVSFDEIPLAVRVDIAEILHIAYYVQQGSWNVLNHQMGGSRQWYFAKQSTPVFNRIWTPEAFINFISSKDKIKEIAELYKKDFQDNLTDTQRKKILQATKTHMTKHERTTINWKEFQNVGNKYFAKLQAGLNQAGIDFLNQINDSFLESLKQNNIFDFQINMNIPLLEKQIKRQIAFQIQQAIQGNQTTVDFTLDASFFIFASLKFNKGNLKDNSKTFLKQIKIDSGKSTPLELTSLLKKWTVQFFSWACNRNDLLNQTFYQKRVDKHSKEARKMVVEDINFYSLKQLHKKERDLNYVVHNFFLKILPNVRYVFNYSEWEVFYNQQMNLYMQLKKQNFSYFNYNNKFYAYHITGPTSIIDADGDSGYIATRVWSEGAFDKPTEIEHITIY